MISKGDFLVIHELKSKGYSIRAIARMLEIDRKTVTRKLNQEDHTPVKRSVTRTESKLDPYKNHIVEFISKSSDRIPYSVILDDIIEMGYSGSKTILQDFLTKEYETRRIINDPVVRFETLPGVQMQIDWTTIKSGKTPIYAFVAVLGYSRRTFVHFVDNMEVDTLVMCHEKAFLYFGGTTKTILYDNMKAIVIERNFYGNGQHRYNPKMLDLAKKCGFEIKLCKPYRAKTKGKVERFNSYLKGNFYRPVVIRLKDAGLMITHQVLNERINKWLTKANNRIHGTTRQRPVKVFIEHEAKCMIPYASCNSPNTPMTSFDMASNTTQQSFKSKYIPQTVVQRPNLMQYDQLLTGAVA